MLDAAIAGLAAGAAYALLGVCLTVMYRLVRTLNFAQLGVSVLGAYTTVALTEHGVSLAVATVLGLLVSAVVAAALGLVMSTWFSEAGPDQRSALTIAFLLASVALAFIVFGNRPHRFAALVSGGAFNLLGVRIGWVTVACAAGAAALAAGWPLLVRTALGLRLEALAERPTTAELLGVRTRPLVVGVWVATTLVTTFVLLLIGPTRTSDQLALALLVVPAAAAALVGALRSPVGALLGGLGLGALQGALASVTVFARFRDTVPFLAIVAILLWSQRREVWDVAR
jgi:branched-chain amino acid transport system permease protein